MNYVACFLLSILSFNCFSADYVLKWGINVEPIIYFSKASKEFKARLEARTNGRISVELYENTVAQEGHDHLGDVKKNTFQMSQETVFQLQKIIPDFAIWNLPYLFKNDEHVIDYTKSPHAIGLLNKLEAHGVIGIDYTYSGGFLYLVGDKVESFKDFEKANVALEESSNEYSLFIKSHFHSAVTDVDFKNLASSGSKKNVSEIIASTAREIIPLSKKKQLFIMKSNHRVISRVLFISKSFLESLPDDLRRIVLEEAKRVAAHERDLSIADKNSLDADLQKANIKIVNWSGDKLKLERNHFHPLYLSFIEKFGKDPLSLIKQRLK